MTIIQGYLAVSPEKTEASVEGVLCFVYYGNFPNPLLDEQGQLVTYADGTEVGHLRGGRRYAFGMIFDYGDWDFPPIDSHPDPMPEGEQEQFGPDPRNRQNTIPFPSGMTAFQPSAQDLRARRKSKCCRAFRAGPEDEMTRTDHRLGDNYSKNHPNTGQEPSKIDRGAWKQERNNYFKQEWDSGRFKNKP